MITGGSSITLLLRRRYAFWTDAPKGIVERMAKNLHLTFRCDEFWALPYDEMERIDNTASPKRLLHVHHIVGRGNG